MFTQVNLILVINFPQINALMKILQLHALILVLGTEYWSIIYVFVLEALMMMELAINANYATILGLELYIKYIF